MAFSGSPDSALPGYWNWIHNLFSIGFLSGLPISIHVMRHEKSSPPRCRVKYPGRKNRDGRSIRRCGKFAVSGVYIL
jgi:hypothetical protein